MSFKVVKAPIEAPDGRNLVLLLDPLRSGIRNPAVLIPVLPAAAAPAGGNGQFGVTPVPDASGRAAAYFTLTVAAGESVTDNALVSNGGHVPENLKIGSAAGVTAGNGGSAFKQAFGGKCSGTGCWVSGLAGGVSLPAGTAEVVKFVVRVPPGTPPGQYLAGLTVEPVAKPPSKLVGKRGQASARVVIIQQVTVGVAVTVGDLSRMTTRLQIPGVSGQAIGSIGRLNVGLANTGQTFAHGTGRASCAAAGRSHSFGVYASTVLPHGQAVIAVNAPGLPEGVAMPCTCRSITVPPWSPGGPGWSPYPPRPARALFTPGRAPTRRSPAAGSRHRQSRCSPSGRWRWRWQPRRW